jgi:SAM-dependent methyltransferase
MKLDTRLHADDYVASRLAPRLRQVDFLCLSDIVKWLPNASKSVAGRRILDFGSGSAPYRSLFSASEYVCADFGLSQTPTSIPLDEDGLLSSIGSGSFGAVLSFQVLEHVDSPDTYLREARRTLEPRGVLVLTTHGIFPKHSVPADYWRWTADGLARTVAQSGFEVESIVRLTTSRRAIAQLALLRSPGVKAMRAVVPVVNWLADRSSRDCAVVAGSEPDGDLAVIVGVIARKAD